jgi:hypothetical protein
MKGMSIMHKFIEDISKQFVYTIIQGVSIDLEHFLESKEQIKKYDIKTTEDEKYVISIWPAEFEELKIRNIFFSLMKFMDYTATFYTYEISSDDITYYLLSRSLEDNLGFYFIITFRQR